MNSRTVSIKEYLDTNQPTEEEKLRIRAFLKHLDELPEPTKYCENVHTDRESNDANDHIEKRPLF